MGNVAGEVLETAAEVALTAGAAAVRASAKGVQEVAEAGLKKATKELVEEGAEKSISKKIAVVQTKLSLNESIKLSREAFERAMNAWKKLPPSKQTKTIASDGFKTVSGYAPNRISNKTRDAIGSIRDIDPEDVIENSKKYGYKPKSNSSLDHSVPGREKASHAEKQLMSETDDPVGVSREMCKDCKEYGYC